MHSQVISERLLAILNMFYIDITYAAIVYKMVNCRLLN